MTSKKLEMKNEKPDDRYTVHVGDWGAFFFDTFRNADMKLHEVNNLLNGRNIDGVETWNPDEMLEKGLKEIANAVSVSIDGKITKEKIDKIISNIRKTNDITVDLARTLKNGGLKEFSMENLSGNLEKYILEKLLENSERPRCKGKLKHEEHCGGFINDDERFTCPSCGWYLVR